MILVIDTAHATALVALADSDGALVAERSVNNTPRIGRDVVEMIDGVLRDAGKDRHALTRIGIHTGPGSYSLLRTGAVTGAMLAWALRIPLVDATADTVHDMILQSRAGPPLQAIKLAYSTQTSRTVR